MANHKSAEKSIRKIARRTAVNRARVSRIRTFVKGVEEAIATGDVTQAREAFKIAEQEVMRGVTKGVLKKNTASRKVSRLSKQVKTLSLASAASA